MRSITRLAAERFLTDWVMLQGGKEEEEAEDKEKPLPLLPTLKALLAAWDAASHATATKRAPDMAQALTEALQPGQS